MTEVIKLLLIDESCTNVVSKATLDRMKLKPAHPYKVDWVNETTIPVTHRCLVPLRFATRFATYKYHVWCDVLPLDFAHLLLGWPWIYDGDLIHFGKLNIYTFIHNGPKIILKSSKPHPHKPPLNALHASSSTSVPRTNKQLHLLTKKYIARRLKFILKPIGPSNFPFNANAFSLHNQDYYFGDIKQIIFGNKTYKKFLNELMRENEVKRNIMIADIMSEKRLREIDKKLFADIISEKHLCEIDKKLFTYGFFLNFLRKLNSLFFWWIFSLILYSALFSLFLTKLYVNPYNSLYLINEPVPHFLTLFSRSIIMLQEEKEKMEEYYDSSLLLWTYAKSLVKPVQRSPSFAKCASLSLYLLAWACSS